MTIKNYTIKKINIESLAELGQELAKLGNKDYDYNLKVNFTLYNEDLNSLDFLLKLLKKDKELANDFIQKLPLNVWRYLFTPLLSEGNKKFVSLLSYMAPETQQALFRLGLFKDKINMSKNELLEVLLKNENNELLMLKNMPTSLLGEIDKAMKEEREKYYYNIRKINDTRDKSSQSGNDFMKISACAQIEAAILFLKSKRVAFEGLLWAENLEGAQQYYKDNHEDLVDTYHYTELAFHFYQSGYQKITEFLFKKIDDITSHIPYYSPSNSYPVSKQIIDILSEEKMTQKLFAMLSQSQASDLVQNAQTWLAKDIVEKFYSWQVKDLNYLKKLGFSFTQALGPYDERRSAYASLEQSLLRQAVYDSNKIKLSLEDKFKVLENLGFSTKDFLSSSKFLVNFMTQEKSTEKEIIFCLTKCPELLNKNQDLYAENNHNLQRDDFLLFTPLAVAILTEQFGLADKILAMKECSPNNLLKLNTKNQEKKSGLDFIYAVKIPSAEHYHYLIERDLLNFKNVDTKSLNSFVFDHLLQTELDPSRKTNDRIKDCYLPLFEKILTKLSSTQIKELEVYFKGLLNSKSDYSAQRKISYLNHRNEGQVVEKISLLLGGIMVHEPSTIKKTVRKL